MINFLEQLLEQLDFNVEYMEESNSILLTSESANRTQFFYLLPYEFATAQAQLSKSYESILQSLQNFNQQELSKNLSVIFLWKVNSVSDIQSYLYQVFEIEEDPYLFQKYVLYYTAEELSLVRSHFEEATINFEAMQEYLHNPINFSEFKRNPTQQSVYSLLSRIFIKLPVLTTGESVASIYNLSVQIQDKLDELKCSELVSKVLEESWDSLEEDELLSKVMVFK